MVANESLQRIASAHGGMLQRAGGLLLGEHARQPLQRALSSVLSVGERAHTRPAAEAA
jgi:hypothetical protein